MSKPQKRSNSLRSWFVCSLTTLTVIIVEGLLAQSANASQIYTLNSSHEIQALVDDGCTGQDCTWTTLDRNPQTIALAGDERGLYQLHQNGAIWRFTNRPCDVEGCLGWERLDNNFQTQEILAGGGQLYQRHQNGSIWRFTGGACIGNVCRSWERLDNNPQTRELAIGGTALYQRHQNGSIWRFTGTACTDNVCPGWERLDNNPATVAMVATEGQLYQRHRSGAIWAYTGQPCTGNVCRGWQRLDNNPATTALVADRDALYQLHASGALWRYTGTPCQGDRCPGWQLLDNNPQTANIVSADGALYQIHRGGQVWIYTGQPCREDRCRGWRTIGTTSPGRGTSRDGAIRANLWAFYGDALTSTEISSDDLTRRFGYRAIDLQGSRPLLVLLADVQAADDDSRLYPLRATEEYREIVFGNHRSGLDLASFITHSSSQRFRFTNAGVIEIALKAPRNSTDPNVFVDVRLGDFVQRAAQAGVNFASFDRNRDGTVDSTELSILVIDNNTRGLGAVREVCESVGAGSTQTRVCLNLALAGGESIFANLSHELSHLLKSPPLADLYGTGCFLNNVALMGFCTAQSNPEPLQPVSVGLSPWNRLRLGWLRPRVQYANLRGAVDTLAAPSYSFLGGDRHAVILYDPSRNTTREYFIFEHRTNAQGSRFVPYDRSFTGRGITPYYVNWSLDPETNSIPPGDRLMLMSTDPAVNRRGNLLNPFWSTLTYIDGQTAGVQVRGAYATSTEDIVALFEWSRGPANRPRLGLHFRRSGMESFGVQPGGRLILSGAFGINQDNRRFFLVAPGQRYELTVATWQWDQVVFDVPAGVTAGINYAIVTTHPSWDSDHTLNGRVQVSRLHP